jgi:hypothetical protein
VKTLTSEKIIQPGAEKRKAAEFGKARTTAAKLARRDASNNTPRACARGQALI